MLDNLIHLIYKPLYKIYIAIRISLVRLLHSKGEKYCTVCKTKVKRFNDFGKPARKNAQCPACGSLERHRLDWHLFEKKTNLFDSTKKSFLHVAPEKFLSQKFKEIKNLDYLSVDLISPRAMEKMDITNIHYPDNSFSIIYCSHVLEHIPDDKKAISELFRVLKPGGWALLQVPITAEKTHEDLSITDPKEREKTYGHWDHVRACGPDYIERLKDAGFESEIIYGSDLVTEVEANKIGIQLDRLIFFSKKN